MQLAILCLACATSHNDANNKLDAHTSGPKRKPCNQIFSVGKGLLVSEIAESHYYSADQCDGDAVIDFLIAVQCLHDLTQYCPTTDHACLL